MLSTSAATLRTSTSVLSTSTCDAAKDGKMESRDGRLRADSGNHRCEHPGSGSAVLPGVPRISNGDACLRLLIRGTSPVRTSQDLSGRTVGLPLF